MFERETGTGSVSRGFIETNREVWAPEKRLSCRIWEEGILLVAEIICVTPCRVQKIEEKGKPIDVKTSKESEGKTLWDCCVWLCPFIFDSAKGDCVRALWEKRKSREKMGLEESRNEFDFAV
jgi:hypothetical protein